jgi:hypothetical protein
MSGINGDARELALQRVAKFRPRWQKEKGGSIGSARWIRVRIIPLRQLLEQQLQEIAALEQSEAENVLMQEDLAAWMAADLVSIGDDEASDSPGDPSAQLATPPRTRDERAFPVADAALPPIEAELAAHGGVRAHTPADDQPGEGAGRA